MNRHRSGRPDPRPEGLRVQDPEARGRRQGHAWANHKEDIGRTCRRPARRRGRPGSSSAPPGSASPGSCPARWSPWRPRLLPPPGSRRPGHGLRPDRRLGSESVAARLREGATLARRLQVATPSGSSTGPVEPPTAPAGSVGQRLGPPARRSAGLGPRRQGDGETPQTLGWRRRGPPRRPAGGLIVGAAPALTVLLLAGARADPAAPDAPELLRRRHPALPDRSRTPGARGRGAPLRRGDVAPPARSWHRTTHAPTRRAPGTPRRPRPPPPGPPHPRDPLAIGRELRRGRLRDHRRPVWLSSRRAPWGRARPQGTPPDDPSVGWNLASRHFYRVSSRTTTSPASVPGRPWDHRRGRHTVAVRGATSIGRSGRAGPTPAGLPSWDAWAAHETAARASRPQPLPRATPDSPRRRSRRHGPAAAQGPRAGHRGAA